jgi:hypothetical protein
MTSGPAFMFFATELVFSGTEASGPVFMFCVPGLVCGGRGGVGFSFHVLRSRIHFRRYRGRRVPFSYFTLPGSFSAVPRASGPILMMCAPRLILGSTEGVGSRFHFLRSRTRFRRFQGHQIQFSCLVLPKSFSAVEGASGSVFMFCAPEHVFGGTEGVGSRFHVLHFRTHFRRYRGRRVPFLCFAHPDSFSAVSRASGPVFMFWAPALISGGTECVRSRFHGLRSETCFRRCRVRRITFSCFTLLNTFS